jgi:hypothetical protein
METVYVIPAGLKSSLDLANNFKMSKYFLDISAYPKPAGSFLQVAKSVICRKIVS